MSTKDPAWTKYFELYEEAVAILVDVERLVVEKGIGEALDRLDDLQPISDQLVQIAQAYNNDTPPPMHHSKVSSHLVEKNIRGETIRRSTNAVVAMMESYKVMHEHALRESLLSDSGE